MKRAFLPAVFLLLIFSCQPIQPDFGIAEKYYPSAKKLQDGVVNKYYIHFDSKDNYEANTNIEYRVYQLLDPQELQLNNYNAAYEMTRNKVFRFENNLMILKSENLVYKSDTVPVEIIHPEFCNWASPEINFEKTTGYKTWHRRWKQGMKAIRDTVILDRPAKIIERSNESIFVRLPAADSTVNKFISVEKYVWDIGMFSMEYTTNEGHTRMELIEQMSLSEFKKRADHGQKRVAYIDPANTMDKASDFETCHPEHRIADYYNGRPNAQFVGGKGALKQAISSLLDSEKLRDESGYLTFRFVINCRGQIGRFVTEQADLDFQKKQFNPETVQHLFEIISALGTWQPVEIRKEKRDAYAYITFKLKDGNLIELLP